MANSVANQKPLHIEPPTQASTFGLMASIENRMKELEVSIEGNEMSKILLKKLFRSLMLQFALFIDAAINLIL